MTKKMIVWIFAFILLLSFAHAQCSQNPSDYNLYNNFNANNTAPFVEWDTGIISTQTDAMEGTWSMGVDSADAVGYQGANTTFPTTTEIFTVNFMVNATATFLMFFGDDDTNAVKLRYDGTWDYDSGAWQQITANGDGICNITLVINKSADTFNFSVNGTLLGNNLATNNNPNDYNWTGISVSNAVADRPKRFDVFSIFNGTTCPPLIPDYSVGYEGRVFSLTETDIVLNMTYNTTQALLWWNGTSYNTSDGNNKTIFYYNLTLPNIDLNVTSVDLFWNYTNQTGDWVQTINYTQVINRTRLYRCSASPSFSYILKDEETDANVTGTYEATFNLFYGNTGYENVSFDFSASHAYHLCRGSDPDLDLFTYAIMSYTATGYDTRSYYLYNATVTNATTLTNLYLSNTSTSTQISFNVEDEDGNEVDGAYIIIQKYDPGTNTYSTVEIIRTVEGEASAPLIMYTTWYKILIEYNGETVYETTQFIITNTEYYWQVHLGENALQEYEQSRNIEYNLWWQNSTGQFRLTYADTTGITQYGCLEVIRRGATRDINNCTSCIQSTSGTIICNIGVNATGTYIATASINTTTGNRYILEIMELDRNNAYRIFGAMGIFITFLLFITVAFVKARESPASTILLGTITLLIVVILNIFKLTYTSMVVFIIMAIYFMVKSKT